MTNRKSWMKIAAPGMRVLGVLALVVTGWFGAVASGATQGGGTSNVAIVATENGQSVFDACFVLVSYSNEGCDANRDGDITFADIPLGTYTLRQTRDLGPGRSIPDSTITVTGRSDGDGWERFYVTVQSSGSGQTSSRVSDVAVVATQNGQPVYDACFILVGYSNEGCDENRDGDITFADIPLGTYTLRQTRDLGPGRSVPDSTIRVTGAADNDGWERFHISINSSGSSQSGMAYMDIGASGPNGHVIGARFTVTTMDGTYLGSCTLEGHGNEPYPLSCQVQVPRGGTVVVTLDLNSIPPGTAPVQNPVYFDTMATNPGAASHWGTGFQIHSIGGSGQSSAVDIALITREPENGRLLTDTCYVLVGYSNVGCDENGDGQVTFAAIPFGTYTVRQTQTPAGYPPINDFLIHVDSSRGAPLGFLVRQAPEQNAPNTRNVSVVFLDSRTDTRIVTDICAQFVNASNVGCDEDLRDGQIDFLDVPAGTHPITFSNVPAGWQIQTGSTVTIDAGPGAPTHQMIFVQVSTTDGGGTGNAAVGMGAIAVVGGVQTGTTPGGTSPVGATVELILDTSGSMNDRDQQGNQTRLDVAKTVTTRLVTETLPVGVPMALRTYSGCSSSLTIPMQPLDPSAATATINGLRASGQTPIAQSLRAAATDLASVSGQKIIVLITDGEETCGGDPRAAIEALVAQDITVQVNIVGFAINDAALTATFQEWARAGNGTYYQASNELELDQAVTMASQLSFRVIDQQGMVVAEGVVGGGVVSVPAGTYAVEIDTVPITRHENVVVTAQETTTIDLGTGGTTGSGGGIISPSNSTESTGTVVTAQDTWTASVQIKMCETPPTNGSADCLAESGIVVNISLASGEFMGSCTVGEPQMAPWGEPLSVCTVAGMPFNADFIATQDTATIPAGYEPLEHSQTFHMGDQVVWGGDQATFSFTNIRSEAHSSSSGQASLLTMFQALPGEVRSRYQ